MCGIIGYIGPKKSLPIILDGLKRMEYRGYDSAGVALMEDERLQVIKKQGKLEVLKGALKNQKTTASLGLGHIRWATHGAPSDINAHPHTDCHNQVAIVHNGIIENYQDLKDWLQNQGHRFKTETDSEILAHLIGHFHKTENLAVAVSQALKKIRGAYGLAVISQKEPNKIIVARLGSPVVLGIGKKERMVASDVTAILPLTKNVIFLEEGEMAILTKAGHKIISLDGQETDRQPQQIDWDIAKAEKGGYDHFMLKEIMEAPETVQISLRGRAILTAGKVVLGGLLDVMDQLAQAKRLIIVACGTAHYAGRIAEYIIENLVGLPVEVEYASEFRYREEPLDPQTIVLAISQSGETADTLAAIRLANQQKNLTLGIVNTVGSSIARETTAGIYNHIGPEIAVASTKAFISQLVIVTLLAILLGQQRKLTTEQARAILMELDRLPEKIKTILEQKDQIAEIAKKYYQADDFIFIGRKLNYPIALEGALKMKEISYIHAEGYPAGELKHGPLALIDETWPVVAIVSQDSVYEKTLSNLQEVKARKGKIIAIATAGDQKISSLADQTIFIPKTLELLSPILTVIPLQLLAYYVAKLRGCPIDQPRNLAKSVTVE